MIEKVRDIFKREAKAIENIPINDSFEKAIEIIHKHVHGKNGKLVTSGMGKAGQIAHNIATTFSSTGTPSIFLHPSEAHHFPGGFQDRHAVLRSGEGISKEFRLN